MKFVVVVLACVLVAVSAQQYNKYQPYNQYNQYNRYQNQYNPYNRYQNQNQYKNQYQNQFQSQYQNKYTPYKSPSVIPAPLPAVVVSPAKPAVIPAAPEASVVVSVPEIAPAVLVKPVAAVARVASDDRSAETVKYGDEFINDGRNYYFETNNGIAVQAQLLPRNYGGNPPVVSDVAQGSFSWTSPEGKVVAISYTADENGYQPSGDALPQAPEVPAQIARALAYGARFSAGIKN